MKMFSGKDANPKDETAGASPDPSPSVLEDSTNKAVLPTSPPSAHIPRRRFWFGLRSKLITIFVAIKVIPLILLCWLAWQQIIHLGQHMQKRTDVTVNETRSLMKDVGKKAGEDSIRALDVKSREAIERLTTDTAKQVADFLYQRDQQVLLASQLSPDERRYRQFLQPLKRSFLEHGKWVLKGDQWVPAEQRPSQLETVMTEVADNRTDWHYRSPERQGHPVLTPLYAEMTFVGLDGVEKIKVTTVPWMSRKLQDIKKRENTFCKAEAYGSSLSRLKPGEVYVSEVIGAYVPSRIVGPYTQATAKKKGIPFQPEVEAYAGEENPVGRRF